MKAYLPLLVYLSHSIYLPTAALAKDEDQGNYIRVWAAGCAHIPIDRRNGRASLGRAILQSEGRVPGAQQFDWDIMLDTGDLSASQTPPGDHDGEQVVEQYNYLSTHRREQIYNVSGNHDAPYADSEPGAWFRKWGDPLGENTRYSGVDPARRPFPVVGEWERYRFQVGNILFLMLSDRNDVPLPVGRGESLLASKGGYPPGAVTRDTFNWWKTQVLENQDKIIITMHHHMLRETTVGSGRGEGSPRYHGAAPDGEGSSYLYYLIENEAPEAFHYTADANVFEAFLAEFDREHGYGAIDLWIGGHTHAKGPDDTWGGKSISERVWGVTFLQVGALSQFHGNRTPMSRLLTFEDGVKDATAEVYLHEANYQDYPIGFYDKAEKSIRLRHTFTAPVSQALP